MAYKPSTSTFVLGLLLSLSVAVLGSAFAPHHRNLLSVPSKRFSPLGPKSQPDGVQGSNEQTEEIQSLEEDTLRGGAATATLPSILPTNPTLADFRKFALPCLALWVSGPLLSLVDTTFVGLSGSPSESARQLAVLGPATTFFDGATYLFAFLNVATTNLYSSARARKGEQSDEAEGVVRTAARVAWNSGIGLMLFLFFACRPLLKLYIGKQ